MKKIFLIGILLLSTSLAYSQCSNVFPSSRGINGVSAPNCNDQSFGGLDPYESITFSVVSGTNYRVAINDINWNDESVSVYNNANGAFIGGSSGSAGANFTWTAGFTGTVRVVATRGCINTGSFGWFSGMNSATLTYRQTGTGDPSVFGSNSWRVYAYTGRDRDLGGGLIYNGFYTESNLTYDSRNRWGTNNSPSDASGYQGCPVGVDNHTVVSKRQGFPTGTYYIDVNNHDDEIRLFVNGTEVFENGGCCAFHCNVWSGTLNASSTVEFRHAEGGGGSHQGLNFKPYLINGVNEWNFYAFNGRNRDNLAAITYMGYYTRNTLSFNTSTDYGASGSPAAASGYVGCDPGADDHTVVAMRQGFPCAVYSLNVTNHDDEASLIVNGATVWTANCCNNTGVKWTGVLDATSTVEMRYAEGGGGNNMGLTLTDVTSSLNAGTISYGGSTSECDGYNPPAFGNSASPSGGSSAAVNNGSTAYQWQLNGSNISGATGATYDPPALGPGTHTYRRVATDKCGGTANSNAITITVNSLPGATTAAGGGTYCTNGTRTITASGGSGGTIYYQGTTSNGTSTATPSTSVAVSSSGTYYFRARNAAGCWGPQGSVSIVINPLPGDPNVFGTNEWNVYCYEVGNYDLVGVNYVGYYVETALSYNTLSRYSDTGTPASASGFQGCDPGVDNHTVVYKRQGFPCATYQLNIPNHDDGVRVFVNGSQVFTNAGCCLSHTNIWTGVLGASDNIEFRHQEGVGGSNQALDLIDVTTSLDGGVISYSGLTSACDPYNPPAFGNSSNASGGTSAAVTNGSTAYQWQLNGSNISGATGATYDPPSLGPGTYVYRRVATDKCGNSANSNSVTITVFAIPTTASAGSNQTVCATTATLAGNTPAVGSGTWTLVGGSGSITSPGSPNSGVTGLGVGANTFRWTISNGACPNSTDDVIITRDALPSTANAGGDFEACINLPTTMGASAPATGTGAWTWSPSSPTYVGGTNANDNDAQVVFASAGVYTGTWTVSNGVCPSSSDNAVLNVKSAANNVSLVASTSTTATEVCVEAPWTYYANPATPDDYIFAIAKNGNTFTADVTVTDVPGTNPIESLGGQPNVRGTWLISRYWNVTLSSGDITTSVDVRFFIDENERVDALNAANAFAAANPWPGIPVAVTSLQWFKTTGAPFNPATDLVNGNFTFSPTYLTSSGTGTINGVRYFDLTGITSFSGGTGGFSVNDDNSPLPVELLSFEARAVDNQYIRLDWATASEINNDGFELLRSTDGSNFERIAWLEGNGNSTVINEYSYSDNNVVKGQTYYYQLRQVDFDGQSELFNIVSARLSGSDEFVIGNLIPNPSKENDVVNVRVQTGLESGELITIQVYNHIGVLVAKEIKTLANGENILEINTRDLASGTYFLNFESSFGIETRKLVIIR